MRRKITSFFVIILFVSTFCILGTVSEAKNITDVNASIFEGSSVQGEYKVWDATIYAANRSIEYMKAVRDNLKSKVGNATSPYNMNAGNAIKEIDQYIIDSQEALNSIVNSDTNLDSYEQFDTILSSQNSVAGRVDVKYNDGKNVLSDADKAKLEILKKSAETARYQMYIEQGEDVSRYQQSIEQNEEEISELNKVAEGNNQNESNGNTADYKQLWNEILEESKNGSNLSFFEAGRQKGQDIVSSIDENEANNHTLTYIHSLIIYIGIIVAIVVTIIYGKDEFFI